MAVQYKNAPPSKTAKGSKPAPAKGKPSPVFSSARSLSAASPRMGLKTHTANAPTPVTTHVNSSDDLVRKQTGVKLHKENVKEARKADADALFAKLTDGGTEPSEVGKGGLETLSTQQLHALCSSYGKGKDAPYSGHSTLSRDEVIAYLVKGVKPAPKKGSTRELKATASELKKAGTIVGPVSSLKVADLKKFVALAKTAKTGETIKVVKPAPKAGTMDHNKGLLRNADGVGYRSEVTAKAKAMFKLSVSALKAEQLKALIKALGL